MIKHARVGSYQKPSDQKSSTLPLDYRARSDFDINNHMYVVNILLNGHSAFDDNAKK